MKQSLAQKVTIGLGATLVLLVANAILSYAKILKLSENEQLVSHAYEVITELEATLSTLKDAETGQRGYLLTGNEKYLEPYQTAIAQVNHQIDRLQQLTADNPRQQQQIQELERAIAAKLIELQETISLRQERGIEAARRVVSTNRGKQIMDAIRQQIADMDAEENHLLQRRSHDSQSSLRSTLLTFTLASGGDLLLLTLVYYLTRQDQTQRRQEAQKQQKLLMQIQTERDLLENSESRYRSLVTATSQAVWITDAQGRIVEELSSKQSLNGQTLASKWAWMLDIHPDDRDAATQQWLQAVRTKTIYESEQRIRVADGSYRYFAVRGVPIVEEAGQIREWVGIHTDITEAKRDEAIRKQAEAEISQLNETLEQRVIERTAQLQIANEEMEAFAYSVSHDLRAPLRAMQGFAEALLEDYGDRLDKTGEEYAGFIIASAQRLEGLIQDLLAYSRVSRADLQLRPVDLAAVVSDAARQLQSELDQRRVEITVQPLLPVVAAHRLTLVQVVTNLLSNAIKFVADGVDPRIQVWAEKRGDWVRLWVVDNGIGIESQYYGRIFRVFERLHGIEAYAGTGIGLAIVRKGVERMGGQVGVESEPEQGSQFWIELQSSEAEL